MDLTDKDDLIKYLQSHGLYTKHSLGQNFLVDREVIMKIVGSAGLCDERCTIDNELVIEVGPGLGTMTEELVKYADEVIAVEMDDKLADLLPIVISSEIERSDKDFSTLDTSRSRNDKLVVVSDDILNVNIPELVGDRKYKVVANIPYYITSKILRLFLTLKNKPETIVVLTQKEVAERICAEQGDHSVLSLSVQAYGDPEIIDIVPASSFFPIPKVNSAILRIRIMNNELRIMDEKELFRLINIGFASKRKTLVNNLSAGLHITKSESGDIIKKMGLSENIRAQELSLDQWKKLAEYIN